MGEAIPVNVATPPPTSRMAAPTSGWRRSTDLAHARPVSASANSIRRAKFKSANGMKESLPVSPVQASSSRKDSQIPYTALCFFDNRDVAALPDSKIESQIRRDSPDFKKNSRTVVDLLTEIKNEEEKIREGGGPKAIDSQHKKGRLTARERIAKLIDPRSGFFELGLYAAHEMYEE